MTLKIFIIRWQLPSFILYESRLTRINLLVCSEILIYSKFLKSRLIRISDNCDFLRNPDFRHLLLSKTHLVSVRILDDSGFWTLTVSSFLFKDGFAQRKEERFVDYYRVPQGKSIKDGQFISHGIHLTSYDKTERKGKE